MHYRKQIWAFIHLLFIWLLPHEDINYKDFKFCTISEKIFPLCQCYWLHWHNQLVNIGPQMKSPRLQKNNSLCTLQASRFMKWHSLAKPKLCFIWGGCVWPLERCSQWHILRQRDDVAFCCTRRLRVKAKFSDHDRALLTRPVTDIRGCPTYILYMPTI